jgi:hypothetical protein
MALLGVAAILFQAILFGWHHHPVALASHAAQPIAHWEGNAPLSPATADDDCDICQTLHHLNGAPLEYVALAPLVATVSAPAPPTRSETGDQATGRAFQARAPPRA